LLCKKIRFPSTCAYYYNIYAFILCLKKSLWRYKRCNQKP